MHPLVYHSGQLEVQHEANTRHVADKLAGWVGPAGEYATEADLFVLAFAAPAADGTSVHFAAVSGEPPLVGVGGAGRLVLPDELGGALPGARDGVRVGGLVLSLASAARARVNGRARQTDGDLVLEAEEAFTLCRKYIAPSERLGNGRMVGPAARVPVSPDDPWAAAVVASAETSFLASLAPDGAPDVAHRGGRAGFLEFDAPGHRLAWSEFVGDGVFKSAGNVRATGVVALLVLDLGTGDALEVQGRGTYANTLTRFRPRDEPLVRLPEPFPQQGRLEIEVHALARLRGFTHPRRRLDIGRVTSRDSPDEQAPR